MDDAKILTEDLLKRLQANRETHRSTFEQALVLYQERMVELLENLCTRAKEGKAIPQRALYDLPMPEDHTNDYDTVIDMLEMEQRKTLRLSERDFRRYVRDQWEWADSFAANTTSYVAAAAAR